MSRTSIYDYDKYLSKVNPEKGRKKAQEQEAKWAEERKKREQEKQTEAYQKELRERAEAAARERRKVEKATAAFNAEQAKKNTVSNTPDKRQLRERWNAKQNIAAHTTGEMGVSRPQDNIVSQMDSFLNAGQLSKEQKQQAKDLLKLEQQRRTQAIRQGNTDLMIPGTDEYNRYQKWTQLEAKTKNAGARGALLPFLKLSNTVTKGIENVTNNQNSNASKQLNKQFENAFTQDELAAEQSPIAHGAGNMAGSAAMYSATNPLFDSLAGGLGVSSTLGKVLVNQLAQNAQDVAIDTLPEVQRMRDKGMSDEAIRKATIKNVLGNALGNAVMQGVSDVAIPALRNALDKTPRMDMDEFRRGLSKLEAINNPNSAPIPRLEDNLKQIEEAVQKNTDDVAKVAEANKPLEEYTERALRENEDIPFETPANPNAVDTRKHEPLFNQDDYDRAYKEMEDLYNRVDPANISDEGWDEIFSYASNVSDKYAGTPQGEEIRNMVVGMLSDIQKEAKEGGRKPVIVDPFEHATSNAQTLRQRVADATANVDFSSITPKAQKNLNRLNTALDDLEKAIANKAPASEVAKYNKEAEKALGALHKNIPGDKELRSLGSTYFGERSSENVNNILRRHIENDIDEGELLFNEREYDKYGRVMLDDEGIPKSRRGVDVSQEINPGRESFTYRMSDSTTMPEDNVSTSLRNSSTPIGDVLESEQKISKVRSNTLQNAGIDNEEELANIIPEDDFKYWTQPEKTTYAEAENRLATDWEGNLEKYTRDYTEKSASDIRSAQDVDAMMLMRNRLNEMARNATDPAEKRRLYEQSRKVALNLRKAGTEAGRNVQAFAKWTRTPEGAIASAQGFAEDLVEKDLKKNPKLHDEIGETARQIESWLDEMDTDALTREEIEDMIRQAMLGRDRLRKRMNDGDIRKIADAIMNDKQYADIQKELEFLSTGFEDIDADTLEEVQDIFERAQGLNYNSKERVDLENEAFKKLALKIAPKGGSFRDKVDAWRYLAMLANPTTHIKNIVGNELFGQGMVSAKNTLAALIEEGADRVSKATGNGGIDRTKAILTAGDKGLLDAAHEDALQNAYRELSGNKYYATGSAIDNAIPAFNSKKTGGKVLNKAADLNTNALNKEDELAVIAKYRTSLAGFLKANGADESIFKATDAKSQNLLESARAYATKQAKEAAFHQESATANALSQFSRNARNSDSAALRALGFGADIVVPFKKTPINILKSAIEYSPAEYLKVATDLKKLRRGSIKAADFIDDLSKATTGTVALGLGALLAHEGIIKIGSSKTDEEQAFDTQTGRQNVAVKVGNKYIGLSELIPAAAPLILGGTIYETIKNSKGEESALNTIFSGMSAISNGVTDMTMLSGIADTLNSVRYAQDKSEVWQKLGINTASNLASQMLPTLGRKINTTIDDTKRSTYSDKTGAMKTIDQEAKYLQTKIPGLQQAGEAMKNSNIPALQKVGDRLVLQPNVDVKGQVQDSPGVGGLNNVLGRALNNFVSPVSITQDKSNYYDNERRRLANATGETKVLPYIASSEAKISDVGQLTPEQWTEYRKQRGQMREELATKFMSEKSYKSMSDADRAEILTDFDDFTKKYSQSLYGKEMSSTDQKLAEVYKEGGADALVKRIQQNNQINAAGLKATDKMVDFLDKGGSLDDYVSFQNKTTTVDEDGKKHHYKDNIMAELAKLPEDKRQTMLEASGVKLDAKEQKAYDAGGVNAALRVWSKDQKEKERKAREKKKQQRQQAAQAGVSVDKLDDLQSELASYGAQDSATTVKYYSHAKQEIPSLTTKQYTQKLHEIGGDDYKIAQKEMLHYFDTHNLTDSERTQLWKAYGNWSTIPVLKKNGTWGTKKAK